ncbi:hypothetical protein [Pseudoalteromonas tunicata]|uniref:hypothetical protein n=1 Tax=Pseudoalteromonas tunicata TaxID=314281 RepID=UPI00273F68D9|nr:hypothetical protein [Pseudoalteromonas tunicata]MDP4983722.1 hypothetical protein [Pseudoalteromonas tunicata]
MLKQLIASAILLSVSQLSYAGVIISTQAGKTFSQTLTTKEAKKIEIANDSHIAFSIERAMPNARYGLYYAKFESTLEQQLNTQLSMQYYAFQSAVEYPLYQDLNGYFGAHLGINTVKPSWTESDNYFAVGLYTGIEYQFTHAARFQLETRWINTLVNDNSKISCDASKNNDDQCLWHFDGDVLTQFQASAGFSYRF